MGLGVVWPFYGFVLAHIATGAIGLVTFWIPVIGGKGSSAHRKWGRVFIYMMLATGTIAIAISTCTLLDPIGTHQHIKDPALLANPELIRGIFGWMMQYLAILTITLAWYGWQAVSNQRDHSANLEWRNIVLHGLLLLASCNVAWRGYLIGQPLMMGISTIGFATVATDLYFLFKPRRGPKDWLREHLKALVGAGISVYTAFFAFGAVRLMPSLALSPILWAVPLTTGLGIIFYHWYQIWKSTRNKVGGVGYA